MKEKELLFIDMDGVLVDFYQGVKKNYPDFDTYLPARQREITAELSAREGFFISLEPVEGAVEAFGALSRHYETYILSTPDWHGVNSWSEKRIWVENHLGDLAFKRLILSHNKGLFTGRALIDDRLRNGVDRFNGEHIHFGTERFPDWQSVLAYLLP
jgi:5'(3')-deoxyribonucleotidase